MKNTFRNKPWYAYTVAICTGVILFVLLTRPAGIATFFGYFSPVIIACAIAYLINPLAKLYERRVFFAVKNPKIKNVCVIATSFITVILVLMFALFMLIPQLVSSAFTFVNNVDKYVTSLESFLNEIGISSSAIGLEKWLGSPDKILHNMSEYISKNMDAILTVSANAGKSLVWWLVAFLISIYILANKRSLKEGFKTFLAALLDENRYETAKTYLLRCNQILNRYIVFNLLDALVVGLINMAFMVIMGMPYVGLVSFVVGLTNLVPTFGPFVGGAIGAFILLLVEPWYAIAFMIFTLVLQLIDGYLLKPKIFGGSLGVPALWILIAVVVGGKMFGVIGILLSVPAIAILDFTYRDHLLPWLKNRDKGEI